MILEFASIVSLIGQFRSERGAAAQSDVNEFLQWLMQTNHAELIQTLSKNADTTIFIKALLVEDHRVFKSKLESIDAAVTSFASAIDGFAGLAKALNPNSALSNQAVDVLQQFEKAGASKIMKSVTYSGTTYMFTDGKGGQLNVSEPRFIEDDLNMLGKLGLLRRETSSKGSQLYCVTRAGSSLVQARS